MLEFIYPSESGEFMYLPVHLANFQSEYGNAKPYC